MIAEKNRIWYTAGMKKKKATLETVSNKIDKTARSVAALTLTVDNLAAATKRGFDEMTKNMNDGFKEVNGRLDKVEERLDQIDGFVTNHSNRIDRLADDMRLVKTKVGMH